MDRVFNFAAGPAVMPEEALRRAAEEMLNYKNTGMSVMEMSHRSAAYQEIFDHTVDRLRQLMAIPAEYEVLLLQGGATGQFAAVAMNLLSSFACYVDSGHFAHSAWVEAQKYGDARCAASTREEGYRRTPDQIPVDPQADYLYITTNNTIYGTRIPELPDPGAVPLVADMSSNILSQPYDVRRFGVIFAGAQKNIGPAGLTVVIVRRDLLGRAREETPNVLNWTVMADKGSRSLMNVTFRTGNEALDAEFVKQAAANGLCSLKGHRVAGGMRASIYNAMPLAGVQKLVRFMDSFEKEHC